jgi:ABC-type uncharacterized transport system substrate-binding protein
MNKKVKGTLILWFTFSPLISKILYISTLKNDLGLLKKIREFSAESVVVVRKANDFVEDNYTIAVVLGDRAFKIFTDLKKDIPAVVGYVKNAFIEFPMRGTGIKFHVSSSKTLQVVKTLCPWVKKVSIIIPEEEKEHPYVKDLGVTAGALDIELKIVTLTKGESFRKAIDEIKGVDMNILVPSPLTSLEEQVRYIILESLKLNIPTVGYHSYHIKMGALISFEVEKKYTKEFIELIKTVLGGRNPTTIPVKYPEEVGVIVNKRVKSYLKIEVDTRALKNAREI